MAFTNDADHHHVNNEHDLHDEPTKPSFQTLSPTPLVESSKPVVTLTSPPSSVDTVESYDSAADETNELAEECEDEDEDAGDTTDVPACLSSDPTMPTLTAPGSLSVPRDGCEGKPQVKQVTKTFVYQETVNPSITSFWNSMSNIFIPKMMNSPVPPDIMTV